MDPTIISNNSLSVSNRTADPAYRHPPRWYFSRREIEGNSPSRRDGIDLNKETYLRMSYSTFLQGLGMKFGVDQTVIARAIIMCHRFFLYQSHAKNDRTLIASACMWLAVKVEGILIPSQRLVSFSYQIANKRNPEACEKIKQTEVFESHKDLIMLAEWLVLRTLEFDLNIDLPYRVVIEALNRFNLPNIECFRQVAWNFVNDSLRTSLCLQFEPGHVAAAAIFLAAKFLKAKLPLKWVQGFDLSPQQLQDICDQMMELYQINNSVVNSRRSQDYHKNYFGSSFASLNQNAGIDDSEVEVNVAAKGGFSAEHTASN